MTEAPKKKKILVVDDEKGLRDMLAYELNFLGYEAVLSQNADEAIVLLRENTFDLLITDIRMPGSMDGIDMVDLRRKEDPGLKAIFISGFTLEDKLNRALEHPLSACLKKPFDLQELSEALKKFLA